MSTFTMERASSGSRWTGVSQTGGGKSSQKTAGGEHTIYEEDFFTENAANKRISNPVSGKDYDYQQMLRYS